MDKLVSDRDEKYSQSVVTIDKQIFQTLITEMKQMNSQNMALQHRLHELEVNSHNAISVLQNRVGFLEEQI